MEHTIPRSFPSPPVYPGPVCEWEKPVSPNGLVEGYRSEKCWIKSIVEEIPGRAKNLLGRMERLMEEI